MMNAAIVFIANYFYFLQNFVVYTYLHSLHVALVLFIYPSIMLYVKSITGTFAQKYGYIWHFIPGIVFFLLYLVFFDIQFSHTERANYLSTYRQSTFYDNSQFMIVNWIRLCNVILIIMQVFFYSIAIIKTSKKYHTSLKNELSNDEKFRIKWLSWFNYALIITAIVSVLFYTINPFSETNNLFLIISMFIMSIFIWLIGIWGNAQPNIDFPKENKIDKPFKSTDEKIYMQLSNIMQSEKVYLNPSITLTEFARLAGTNRSYVSHAINNAGNTNFNSFVNQFRVTEAQSIIESHTDINIDELAIKSGFGSTQSLLRAFKNATGISPTKWKKQKATA